MPEISIVRQVHDTDWFLVLANNGVWVELKDVRVARIVGYSVQEISKEDIYLPIEQACSNILEIAQRSCSFHEHEYDCKESDGVHAVSHRCGI